jgi:hypothetical protein
MSEYRKFTLMPDFLSQCQGGNSQQISKVCCSLRKTPYLLINTKSTDTNIFSKLILLFDLCLFGEVVIFTEELGDR